MGSELLPQSVGVGEEDSQSWHRWRMSVKAAY